MRPADQNDARHLKGFCRPTRGAPVLNGDIVGFEVKPVAVVELQPSLTIRDDLVIDRVGGAQFCRATARPPISLLGS